MKVSLKNIGMLDEAEFEVGDLTIICGENNTGKTYATYSLYGYLDFMRNDSYVVFNLLQEVIARNKKYVDMLDEYTIKILLKNIDIIVTDLFDMFEQTYKANLATMLAGKEGDFKSSSFSTNFKDVVISFIKGNDSKERIGKIRQFFSYSPQFELFEITKEYLLFSYEKSKNQFSERMQQDINYRKENFILAMFKYIVMVFFPKAFILSAERTGASMFQKELDVNKSEIVERISMTDTKNIEKTVIGVLNNNYSRYPKPVKDNIYFVREPGEIIKKISFIDKENTLPLHKEIIELLYEIVGGKYIVSEAGVEFAPGARKRITKGKFSIQCASSSVRSLLMLNYYILNIAQKGNILMIDEPELNLHPKNQILMGRLIALLVNAGIKVFITTHSDYIVRELSNCVMLNSLPNEQIAKFKEYTKEYKLESKKVKAYIANKIGRKNTLKSIDIVADRGILMDSFDLPINSQNDNQGLIFEEILKTRAKDDK